MPLRAARQGIEGDEADVLRALVAGEIPAAELDEVVGGEAFIPPRDESHRHLAPVLVATADHDSVGDTMVGEQDALDLGRVDVLAARLDQVLGTVDEIEPTVRSPDEHIAHVEPSTPKVLRVHFRGVPVAAEKRWTMKCQLSRHSIWHVPVFRIDESEVAQRVLAFRQVGRHLTDGDATTRHRRDPGFGRTKSIGVGCPQQLRDLGDLRPRNEIGHGANQFDSFGPDGSRTKLTNNLVDHAGHQGHAGHAAPSRRSSRSGQRRTHRRRPPSRRC